MLCAEEAPGSDMIKDCEDLEALDKWYEDFGAQYLDRFAQLCPPQSNCRGEDAAEEAILPAFQFVVALPLQLPSDYPALNVTCECGTACAVTEPVLSPQSAGREKAAKPLVRSSLGTLGGNRCRVGQAMASIPDGRLGAGHSVLARRGPRISLQKMRSLTNI